MYLCIQNTSCPLLKRAQYYVFTYPKCFIDVSPKKGISLHSKSPASVARINFCCTDIQYTVYLLSNLRIYKYIFSIYSTNILQVNKIIACTYYCKLVKT